MLGVCEQARGRDQAALEAWVRVTPGSAFAAKAIDAHLSMLIGHGRLAAAEQLINDAATDPRNDRTALRILLMPAFFEVGRLDDALALVEERWEHLHETGEGASELAINLARLHIEMQSKPSPVEVTRADLEQAARLAPDDDRVWLGRANLAIRTGNYAEAKRWLDACERRRPEDIPVWRARLNWAMAARRIDVVRGALAHLPASESTNAQVNRIGAWLAAKQEDRAAERLALERLVAIEPADLTAVKRLAELARDDGRPEAIAEMQRRESEIERLRARYQKLFDRNQPIRDAVEMGRLAEKLGRPFEARVFLSVAAKEGLNRDDLRGDLERLSQPARPAADPGRSLADLIGR